MAQEEDTPPQWHRFTRLKRNRSLLRRRARKIETATLKHAHTFIVRRWDNVRDVRRHALAWLCLVGILVGLAGTQLYLYQRAFSLVAPRPGGTYAEGVVGKLDTINPLYANTSAERAASKLVFSSLLSYDNNNQLIGDLATTWSVSPDGKTYTIDLRHTPRWHDGVAVTASDVVFTVNLMKNPQVNRSLYESWASINAIARDPYTVIFTLPSAYSPFPHALTFGIVPEHSLSSTPPSRLRESNFNRQPVGSGPFEFRSLQVIDPNSDRLVLHLAANQDYYRGAPQLSRFQLHTYGDHDQLRKGFLSNEINAASDVTTSDMQQILKAKPTSVVSDAELQDGIYALMRNDSPVLSDANIRHALVSATNRQAIIKQLGGYALSLDGPVLKDQISAVAGLKQTPYDPAAAAAALDADGWKKVGDIRQKNGQTLELNVVAPRTGDYPIVLEALAKQWRAVGINVQSQLVDPDTIQQNVLLPRAYDVLIYELAIGADPDVYAYWHSSRANVGGLNLADYKSAVSDDLLISARARSEDNLRSSKYATFTKQWLNDAPAVALYQPTLHYVTSAESKALMPHAVIANASDRYRSIQYWTVAESTVFTTP